MALNNYALSIYPLSVEFKKQIENKIGEPIHYILLRQLRQQPLSQIWKYLRSLKVNYLLLPAEYENFNLLIPLLKLLSLPVSANHMVIVNHDLSFIPFKKSQIPGSTVKLFIQFGRAYSCYLKNSFQVLNLLNLLPTQFQVKKNQRILYLDNTVWFGPMAGGSVGHVSGVANALTRQGYSIDYAALHRLPALLPEINFIKIIPPKLFILPEELNRFPLNDAMVSQLLKKSCNYEFIYQRMSINNFAGVILAKKMKIPLVMEYNGPLLWVSKNWRIQEIHYENYAKKCEMVCLQHAQLIVTISEVLKEHLINSGIPSHKILCHPNGIDPIIFNPDRFSTDMKFDLRKQLNIPETALVFSFIGTFGQWHGGIILAKAIKKLIDEHSDLINQLTIRFLLIGNGIEFPKVYETLNKFPYQQYVIFTDIVPQEKAPEYLAISDIFLSPHVPNPDGSRFFGSPTKLFEYMSMGKPIIASKLEQVGEILKNSLEVDKLPGNLPQINSSELAVLCEPGNADHIVTAIIFLSQQPEWRTLLGKNVRKEVLKKFTWDKNVENIGSRLES